MMPYKSDIKSRKNFLKQVSNKYIYLYILSFIKRIS